LLEKILKLANHQGFVKYFKNTGWMMGEQLLRIVAGLFVGIWVARYLGPEQFGLFSYVLAFAGLFGGLAKLGLDGVVVRELVCQPDRRESYLATAFWLKLLGALLVVGLIISALAVSNNDHATSLLVIIVSMGLFFQSFEVVEFHFQSQVQAKVVSICKVFQLFLSSVIKILLILSNADLIYFVVVSAFDMFSLAVSYIIAYRVREKSWFSTGIDYEIAKDLLKSSWPLMFSTLVVMIYLRIDQIMIKEILGEYELGIYSAASKISEAWYFLPTIISTALFPAVLNVKNDKLEYGRRFLRIFRFVFLISIFISSILYFMSEELIILLYGDDFIESARILSLHALGMVFAFSGIVSSKWFISENLQIYTLKRTAIGALVNIALNLIMIPRMGVEGAVYATLISQVLASYLINVTSEKTRGLFQMQTKAFFLMGR
jgi:O-antigen/teichoic acid export membrane protein